MDIKEISANSLSYIGDAVYTLAVRQYFIINKYQSSRSLQKLCNGYNSAAGQTRVYQRLLEQGFFKEEELAVFKAGRNHIKRVPRNSSLYEYQCASGLEAVCGYLYLEDKERLEQFFAQVFQGGINNE